MMILGRSEAGHASNLDSFQLAFKRARLNVHGYGHFQIETDSPSACIVWHHSDDMRTEATETTSPLFTESLSQGEWLTSFENYERNDMLHYESRLTYLRDEAEDEDYEINLASETDFRAFIESQPQIRRGDVVLMENGNLRAIWENDEGSQLGLQFLGDGSVQFVAFVQRRNGKEISRLSGRDSMSGLMRLIHALEVQRLLFK